MKTDIQVGDTVVCVLACGEHPLDEPWSFPPEVGSVWVVQEMHGNTVFWPSREKSDHVGLRLCGDPLPYPGLRRAECFRKVFKTADEESARFDVRTPTGVRA